MCVHAFSLSSVHRRGRPNTVCDPFAGFLGFGGADIFGHFESARHFFSLRANTQRDRRHRTDCAAFHFPFAIFEGADKCIAAENAWLRVGAFECAVLAAVCFGPNTYDVYLYKEPLLSVSSRHSLSAHELSICVREELTAGDGFFRPFLAAAV